MSAGLILTAIMCVAFPVVAILGLLLMQACGECVRREIAAWQQARKDRERA